jgi:small subunit ribosomal protein S2
VTYPIPGNDDAIRSVALLTRVVADAVADGLMSRAGASDADVKPTDDQFSTTAEEPLPEWERDLLEGAPASAATPEVQESAVSDEADADAEIAEAAPDTAAIAEAAAEAAPADAEAAAADAADAATEVAADAAPEVAADNAE